ncbi:hypothetical protein, partial [Nocardia cyriacigeorgica]|uniref:hypothetical protein n=1 Tax=Nocardia cyriacigeorgica TaxID=135487 RepID=UPI00189342E9
DILIRDTGMPPEFVRTRAETEALLGVYGYDLGEVARVLTEFTTESPARGIGGLAAQLFIPDDLAHLRARLDR